MHEREGRPCIEQASVAQYQPPRRRTSAKTAGAQVPMHECEGRRPARHPPPHRTPPGPSVHAGGLSFGTTSASARRRPFVWHNIVDIDPFRRERRSCALHSFRAKRIRSARALRWVNIGDFVPFRICWNCHRAAAGLSQARRKGAPSLGPIRKGPIPRAPPFAPTGTPHNVGAGVSDGYAVCTVEPTAATEPPCRSSLPENSPARERAMRESVGHPIPPSKEVGQKNEHSRIISPLPLSWSSTAHSVYEAENPRSSA